MINCPICQKEYKQLTAQHVKKHQLTIEEFKIQFPDISLRNENTYIKQHQKKLDSCLNDNIQCKECGILITTQNRKKRSFCSHICSANYYGKRKGEYSRRTRGKKICLNCNKEYFCIHTKQKYCDNKCQHIHKYKQVIQQWKDAITQNITFKMSNYIRRYIFEKFNNTCSKCGWGEINPFTKKIPLEVEHIDGNYMNNKEENLTLLCPNCHSLTKTYKGGNRGNGRHNRMKRYHEGKSF